MLPRLGDTAALLAQGLGPLALLSDDPPALDVEALDAIEVSASPLSLDEAQPIIARVEDFVLVGGQTVSAWIGQLEDRLGDRLTTAPVVSRDIDFGSTADLQRAGNLLGGRVHVAG